MTECKSILHNFTQFQLLAPDAVKKCQRIKDEEKNGQTIHLDKYNSKDFFTVINIINTLNINNHLKMTDSGNWDEHISIILNKNKLNIKTHAKTLANFNSKLNNKLN